MILSGMLRRMVRVGELTVIDASGRRHVFKGAPGPRATVRILDRATELGLLRRPDPGLGEAYMDRRLLIEEGTLYDLLELCMINAHRGRDQLPARLFRLVDRTVRRLHQYNPIGRARANVAHHYNLDGRLYELFLDSDRQYSCAYFETPRLDLDAAQVAKKRHIAAKLLLAPGQRVLDIGSGWGGLAIHLASEAGVDVTGVTLSTEQHAVATARAAHAGLADRVRFHLCDYRELTGWFDRIVSVGMFEHVGVNHFGRFFAKVRELLAPDGVALLHSIGRMGGPWSTSNWIRRYIFPGGYIPAMSEVLPAIERQGLWATDIEILRLHYAETLRHWRQRFNEQRDRIAGIYDERFCRMWEFYLVCSELFFRCQDGMVFQLQLARERDAVPLTRDYIAAWKERHRAREVIAA
jgi:cyclopropane-fatty-acyl-phospholipid synthase